jgi:hypothetical protein
MAIGRDFKGAATYVTRGDLNFLSSSFLKVQFAGKM